MKSFFPPGWKSHSRARARPLSLIKILTQFAPSVLAVSVCFALGRRPGTGRIRSRPCASEEDVAFLGLLRWQPERPDAKSLEGYYTQRVSYLRSKINCQELSAFTLHQHTHTYNSSKKTQWKQFLWRFPAVKCVREWVLRRVDFPADYLKFHLCHCRCTVANFKSGQNSIIIISL